MNQNHPRYVEAKEAIERVYAEYADVLGPGNECEAGETPVLGGWVLVAEWHDIGPEGGTWLGTRYSKVTWAHRIGLLQAALRSEENAP